MEHTPQGPGDKPTTSGEITRWNEMSGYRPLVPQPLAIVLPGDEPAPSYVSGIEAALFAGTWDLAVFPCRVEWDAARGKWDKLPPRGFSWNAHAYRESNEIIELWERHGAGATGSKRSALAVWCEGSRVVAFDADFLPMLGGWWEDFVDAPTMIRRSVSGRGVHVIYRAPAEWDERTYVPPYWDNGEVKWRGWVVVSSLEPIADIAPARLPDAIRERLKAETAPGRTPVSPAGAPGRGAGPGLRVSHREASLPELNDWLDADDPDDLALDSTGSDVFLETALAKFDEGSSTAAGVSYGEPRRQAALRVSFTMAVEALSGCYRRRQAYEALKARFAERVGQTLSPTVRGGVTAERRARSWTAADDFAYARMWARIAAADKDGSPTLEALIADRRAELGLMTTREIREASARLKAAGLAGRIAMNTDEIISGLVSGAAALEVAVDEREAERSAADTEAAAVLRARVRHLEAEPVGAPSPNGAVDAVDVALGDRAVAEQETAPTGPQDTASVPASADTPPSPEAVTGTVEAEAGAELTIREAVRRDLAAERADFESELLEGLTVNQRARFMRYLDQREVADTQAILKIPPEARFPVSITAADVDTIPMAEPIIGSESPMVAPGVLMLDEQWAVLVGSKKTGKSRIGFDFLRCSLTGEPFLDAFPTVAIAPDESVCFIDPELGPRMFRWYCERALIGLGPKVRRRFHYLDIKEQMRRGAFSWRTRAWMRWLTDWLAAQRATRVVVDSTLIIYLTGAGVGRNTDPFVPVAEYLGVLEDVFRAAGVREWVFAIHTPKDRPDEAYGSMGWSALPDVTWVTTLLESASGDRRFFEAPTGRAGVEVPEGEVTLIGERPVFERAVGRRDIEKADAEEKAEMKKRGRLASDAELDTEVLDVMSEVARGVRGSGVPQSKNHIAHLIHRNKDAVQDSVDRLFGGGRLRRLHRVSPTTGELDRFPTFWPTDEAVPIGWVER